MEKIQSEIILDNRYNEIMDSIRYILKLADIDENIIDEKLNNSELTQTDLDYALMGLIDVIIDEDASIEVI